MKSGNALLLSVIFFSCHPYKKLDISVFEDNTNKPLEKATVINSNSNDTAQRTGNVYFLTAKVDNIIRVECEGYKPLSVKTFKKGCTHVIFLTKE